MSLSSIYRAQCLVSQLIQQGIKEFVLCAGARNAPLVKALFEEETKGSAIQIFPFFEERSAAFFALGKIQANNRPVAVLTTSGTAVAELLPALIEAWYSGFPLVAVTADRPAYYRGSGAPQSIEQVGIFSSYVEQSWDLQIDEIPEIKLEGCRLPVHINICFDEPLWEENINISPKKIELHKTHPFPSVVKRPLIILSTLRPQEREQVRECLRNWSGAIYVEAPSGLREEKKLSQQRLVSGEGLFNHPQLGEWVDGIIRIGGVPTVRLWRDLEKEWAHWPVVHFTQQPFSGIGRDTSSVYPLGALADFLSHWENNPQWGVPLQLVDQKRRDLLEGLFKNYPQAEPCLVGRLSQYLPPRSLVFLGNSSPIREWDLAASYQSNDFQYYCNRGANGIDGLLSTFFGVSSLERENWVILGDLSALYDLTAPWALRFSPHSQKWRIVVINNFGGQVFRRMFGHPLFINQHEIDFSSVADLWDLDYHRWFDIPASNVQLADRVLIELRPHPLKTDQFWIEYNKLNEVISCF